MASVIECAFQKGARLDGWDEYLDFDLWMAAFQELRLDPEQFLRQRSLSEELPWSVADTGVTAEYLAEEWGKAQAEALTDDCRTGACQECGVCDFDEIYPRLAGPFSVQKENHGEVVEPNDPVIRRFRLRFEKIDLMRFLGHHDMVRAFHRAFRRAGVRLSYSKGFHPQPKMRFTPPIPLGVESSCEFVEFEVQDTDMDVETLTKLLGRSLPDGLNPLELKEISLNQESICGKIQQATYVVIPPPHLSYFELGRKVRELESSSTFVISRERKGKIRSGI